MSKTVFFFMHDQMGCFMSNLSSYTSDIQKNTSMILVQWLIFTSSFRVYRKIKTKYFYQWKYGIQHIHVCTIFFICCQWKPDVTATCIRQLVFDKMCSVRDIGGVSLMYITIPSHFPSFYWERLHDPIKD